MNDNKSESVDVMSAEEPAAAPAEEMAVVSHCIQTLLTNKRMSPPVSLS